jgi:hypothetical protein
MSANCIRLLGGGVTGVPLFQKVARNRSNRQPGKSADN